MGTKASAQDNVKTYTIDNLNELVELLEIGAPYLDNGAGLRVVQSQAGQMFCTTCLRDMKMTVGILFGHERPEPPLILEYACVQCVSKWTAIIYRGPQGVSLAVFGQSAGGLSTPNTPQPVAYYLDQAYKSQAASANTAAIAMYRAALEHLLFEQGYTVRELGAKLGALERDLKVGVGPPWASQVDLAFLKILKDLGNYSIHPNDGDITYQERFDSRLLAQVKATFIGLLDLVYEESGKRAARLKELQAGLKPTKATSNTSRKSESTKSGDV